MIILPRHSLKALLLVVGLWAILMLRHLEALVHTFFVPTTTRYYSQHTAHSYRPCACIYSRID